MEARNRSSRRTLPKRPSFGLRGHTGSLVVRIKLGSSGKTGPDTYRAGARPGANTEVYDDTCRLDRGCYVKWTLSGGSEVVLRVTSGRCRPPSITLFNFEDSLDEPGRTP